MFTRRKSLDDNQTVLSGFVSKNDKTDKKLLSGRSPGVSRGHITSSISSPSIKKRNRPTSPTDNTVVQNNRAHMENNNKADMANTLETQSVNNVEHVPLNPELTELKWQIFAGFESLLAPIKQEIKELKDGQKVLSECNKGTTNNRIERKLVQNDERHKRLENRISVLEDQLLEKNVIFQGIHEEEYKDRSDIKVQIVKAIANTMEWDDPEARKTLAGQTYIDSVERVGKYNPLRTRPVKVKFCEKHNIDHLFKSRDLH